MPDTTQAQKDRLIRDLHSVVAEAEALLKATAGQAGEGSAELRARVQDSLDRARRHLLDLQDAAVERARAAGRAADDYVHDKPWQMIGLAAAVGVLLGLLLSRR
jgi:ElaB/YqjD/DUF883 family membrane-anchored ribosome-binding protein